MITRRKVVKKYVSTEMKKMYDVKLNGIEISEKIYKSSKIKRP